MNRENAQKFQSLFRSCEEKVVVIDADKGKLKLSVRCHGDNVKNISDAHSFLSLPFWFAVFKIWKQK